MKLLERDNSAFFVVFSPLECAAGSFFVRELIMGGMLLDAYLGHSHSRFGAAQVEKL